MRLRWIGAALALGLTVHSAAQEVITPHAQLHAQGVPPIPRSIAEAVARYTDFRAHGFVDWHPTERSMLVRHREAGANVAQIYWLKSPGGVLEPITSFPDPVGKTSFEPRKGRYIVYTRDTGGNEATQVFRMDLDTRASTLLSAADERSSYTWSHRGDRLLISSVPLDRTAREGSRAQISTALTLVDPLQPSQSRHLAELPGGGWGDFEFSTDDAWIAAQQYRTRSDSDVYLIQAQSGERQKILPPAGAAPAGYNGFAWSPDNQRLYLTTNQGGEFAELAVWERKSGALTVLSRHIPWDIEAFQLSPDGQRILAVANANGRDEVHVFDTATGKELPAPAVPAGSVGAPRWHGKHPGLLAYALNSPQSPGEVYAWDADTGLIQRWTVAPAPAGLDLERFASPELIQIPSFDGLSISAWLFLPDAQKFPGKRPVLMSFHGGPEGQSTVRFMGRINYYLNELGIAVLLPNVRGSTGYGKTFMNLDNGFKRKDSVKDAGAFLRWTASHARLDSERIVVTGGSYGGYMSLATAVDYSALIKGAIDVVGISHFVTFLQRTESYRRDLRRLEYGDERDPVMRAFHEEIAPLNHANAIQVPLLVVQGKNDPRVPYTEAEQIVAAVRKQGVSVWYLLADNEGHGFQRKANADFGFYTTVRFLQETLLK